MRVYLLRHGATEATAEGRYQGWLDAPLSLAGAAGLATGRRFHRSMSMFPTAPGRGDGGALVSGGGADPGTGAAGNGFRFL